MKKINKWFNGLASTFGGTYIYVDESSVVHEHYRLSLKGLLSWDSDIGIVGADLMYVEVYKKDGKVIVQHFCGFRENGEEIVEIFKKNYLENTYDFIQTKKVEFIDHKDNTAVTAIE